MIPTPPPPGLVRPADVVNEEIRRLWMDPRVRLSAEGRRRYEVLVAEWTVAVAAERRCEDIVKAASGSCGGNLEFPDDLIALERSAWAEIQAGALTLDTARAVHEGIAAFAKQAGVGRYDVEMGLKRIVRHPEVQAA